MKTKFTIDYETAFTRDLTGRRIPKRETRATRESALRRAREVLGRLTVVPLDETRLGGASGFDYIEAGPLYRASIYAD